MGRSVRKSSLPSRAAAVTVTAAAFSLLLLCCVTQISAKSCSDGGGDSNKLSREQEKAFLHAFEFDRMPHRRCNEDIEIPQFMIDQYEEQTGLEVDTTNFRKAGALTGSANEMRSEKGRLVNKKAGLLNTETVVEFSFAHEDGQDLQAAFLSVCIPLIAQEEIAHKMAGYAVK
jgi:hypothetical protein